MLLCRKDGLPYQKFLIELIEALEKDGFLKERLQVAKSETSESMSYMGICKLGDIHRRIDVKIYPKESYGFALMYFTGSDHFNRSMRLYAKK